MKVNKTIEIAIQRSSVEFFEADYIATVGLLIGADKVQNSKFGHD